MKGKLLRKLCVVSLSVLMIAGAGTVNVVPFISEGLSVSAAEDPNARKAMDCLPQLQNLDAHCSVMLAPVDLDIFRRLRINMTCEPRYQDSKRIFYR